ncbi:hypothetical protein [Oceanobacillus manasiensis]|uniref:hypothetical protein n=1 Tax=Oceanobacillus manasiensis TaxID=586413 RepID=UPI0005A7EF0E|nr:hypothetical protein [Oceanobacillus manasiensis]
MKASEPKWLQHVHDLEKHLDKNEKWLQLPEKRFNTFHNEAEAWEEDYLNNIRDIESFMKEMEKEMDKW